MSGGGHRRSILRRFRLSILATALIAVLVSGSFVIVTEYFVYRDSFRENVEGLGKVVGYNMHASLAFDDPSDAQKTLASLATVPAVRGGVVLRADGTALASYTGPDPGGYDPQIAEVLRLLLRDGPVATRTEFDGQRLLHVAPIVWDGEVLGGIAIDASLEEIHKRLAVKTVAMASFILVATIVAFFAGNAIQRSITQPIQELYAGMREVTTTRRYNVHLERRNNDEIGSLVDGFNAMLAEIAARDHRLAEANEGLEREVQKRTGELEAANRELSETVREVERARDTAQAANRAKSAFLATMSHEIRTPINGMLGNTELLLDEELGGRARQYGEIAYRSGEALLEIVNDILDFSRIEAGELELVHRPFDIAELLEELGASFGPTIGQKGLQLVIDTGAARDRLVVGDEGRLRQVLSNLLTNSVKFTERGTIRVSLSLEDLPEDRKRARFEVEDTGIGIAEGDRERIFERFAQADGSWERPFGGTGLGLAICRELVQRMGGEIGVRSTPGAGSTFWFTVLVADAAAADGGRASARESPKPPAPTVGARDCHALVVDDTEINRNLAHQMLEKIGCVVDVAANGREALERCAGTEFDLVLMDCQMPVMDGFRAVRGLRELEAGEGRARAYVAALTANATKGDRERCLEAGMDDYLAKPFRLEGLRRIVLRAISKSEARREDPDDAGGSGADATQVLDPEAIAEIRALESDDNVRILERYAEAFMASAPDLLCRARAAVEGGDGEGLAFAAHSLKGESAALGASRLAEAARALEEAGRRGRLEGSEECLVRAERELDRVLVAVREMLEDGA
ncbi:MAG: ATP-binding protein [Myxococcota bacterium]|nr:ATP-binding protein [Myxococcota bacterium]